MRKEYKKIKKLSKKIISKNHHKKIRKIKDKMERTEGLKYLIASNLKLKLLELEIKSREVSKNRALSVESKLILLKSKIKIFESTNEKKDYMNAEKLIKEIEVEIKCLD